MLFEGNSHPMSDRLTQEGKIGIVLDGFVGAEPFMLWLRDVENSYGVLSMADLEEACRDSLSLRGAGEVFVIEPGCKTQITVKTMDGYRYSRELFRVGRVFVLNVRPAAVVRSVLQFACHWQDC